MRYRRIQSTCSDAALILPGSNPLPHVQTYGVSSVFDSAPVHVQDPPSIETRVTVERPPLVLTLDRQLLSSRLVSIGDLRVKEFLSADSNRFSKLCIFEVPAGESVVFRGRGKDRFGEWEDITSTVLSATTSSYTHQRIGKIWRVQKDSTHDRIIVAMNQSFQGEVRVEAASLSSGLMIHSGQPVERFSPKVLILPEKKPGRQDLKKSSVIPPIVPKVKRTLNKNKDEKQKVKSPVPHSKKDETRGKEKDLTPPVHKRDEPLQKKAAKGRSEEVELSTARRNHEFRYWNERNEAAKDFLSLFGNLQVPLRISASKGQYYVTLNQGKMTLYFREHPLRAGRWQFCLWEGVDNAHRSLDGALLVDKAEWKDLLLDWRTQKFHAKVNGYRGELYQSSTFDWVANGLWRSPKQTHANFYGSLSDLAKTRAISDKEFDATLTQIHEAVSKFVNAEDERSRARRLFSRFDGTIAGQKLRHERQLLLHEILAESKLEFVPAPEKDEYSCDLLNGRCTVRIRLGRAGRYEWSLGPPRRLDDRQSATAFRMPAALWYPVDSNRDSRLFPAAIDKPVSGDNVRLGKDGLWLPSCIKGKKSFQLSKALSKLAELNAKFEREASRKAD